MKNMKKFASLLLALALIMSLAIPAFAAGEYTITIENSFSEKSYNAYKVFDATYSGDNVSYTIKGTDPWYALVSADTSPFQLTLTTTEDTYFVELKEGKTESDVAEWFNGIENVPGTAAATGTGNGTKLVLDVGAPGYYYITSTLGTTVTVTTAKPTASVLEKNNQPGGGEEDPLTKTASDTEAQIGDSITYTITSGVPSYDGEKQITNYTFTDTLSAGLTPPAASEISVQILKQDDSVFATLTDGISVSDQVITITYDPRTFEGYPADATIKIVYTAIVNIQAAYENGNEVTQSWNGGSSSTSTEETVHVYTFNLKKTDGTNVLDGAKFELYRDDKTTKVLFTIDEETGIYVVDPAGTVSEIEVGEATIKGLDADITYYLKETLAPNGYNMLDDYVEVKVGQEGKFSTTTGINNEDTVVINKAGSELPSTGGMGTTLFYTIGGLMMLAAVVLLATKKRMYNAG